MATSSTSTSIGSPTRWRLDGKTVFVTGGTKGIGKAIVEEYGALGARVFTCARSGPDLAACLKEWTSKGYEVEGMAVDICDSEARRALMEQVAGSFVGRLDVLINNVGTNVRKPTVEYTQEEYDHLMDVNLKSTYHLCQLAHPLLKKAAGRSCVVNVGSVAGVTAIKSGTCTRGGREGRREGGGSEGEQGVKILRIERCARNQRSQIKKPYFLYPLTALSHTHTDTFLTTFSSTQP
jgi:Tropinone reductase 1